MSQLLRICAHPRRLLLLCLLEHKPWSVSALMAETGLNQPTVSQHLARSRNANIVTATRRSKLVYYGLGHRHSSGELRALLDSFCDGLTPYSGQSVKPPVRR